jgi:3'-phosphoadenosine 5'-phosphosulfate (PAPS) 3'-phosphatase
LSPQEGELKVWFKKENNPYTDLDVKVEQIMKAYVSVAAPALKVIAEEGTQFESSNKVTAK